MLLLVENNNPFISRPILSDIFTLPAYPVSDDSSAPACPGIPSDCSQFFFTVAIIISGSVTADNGSYSNVPLAYLLICSFKSSPPVVSCAH